MRCEKCDHDNDAGASMCAGCGAYLSAPTPVDTRPPLSEYAESALTLALIGPLLLGLTALLALPVGVVGLVEVRRSRGRLRGTGHAIAAIVISLVVIATVAGLAFHVVGNPFPGACEDCQPQAMGVDGGNGGSVRRPTPPRKTQTAFAGEGACATEVDDAHTRACLVFDDRAGRVRAGHSAA